MADFDIYLGSAVADDTNERILALPPPPPWRDFDGGPVGTVNRDAPVGRRPQHRRTVPAYRPDDLTRNMVNLALHLRRPLLVSGVPGTGKSELAYAVAQELRLGEVLRWPITSRTELRTGLYHYDAIGRIEDAGVAGAGPGTPGRSGTPGSPEPVPHPGSPSAVASADLGRYLRLGPLGTALAPFALPRVLLIDEIDKADVDLPNDLLDVLEEGEYEIPELIRVSDAVPTVRVWPHDGADPVTVHDGRVRCRAFPFVVMTSNGDREFPPAFLRRCVRLELQPPDPPRLREIVEAQLGSQALADAVGLVTEYIERRKQALVATDQLLNAVYLVHQAGESGTIPSWDDFLDAVLRPLDGAGAPDLSRPRP